LLADFCCILVMISILILTACHYDDMLNDMSLSRTTRHTVCHKGQLHHMIGYIKSPELRTLCYSKDFHNNSQQLLTFLKKLRGRWTYYQELTGTSAGESVSSLSTLRLGLNTQATRVFEIEYVASERTRVGTFNWGCAAKAFSDLKHSGRMVFDN
jgi:hypothetical protein